MGFTCPKMYIYNYTVYVYNYTYLFFSLTILCLANSKTTTKSLLLILSPTKNKCNFSVQLSWNE